VGQHKTPASLVCAAHNSYGGLALNGHSPTQDQVADLILAGGEFAMRIFKSPVPVVAACTGHSLAMGAIVLLACDLRVGPSGKKAKLGLNEVHLGKSLQCSSNLASASYAAACAL
jgi:enoyl-CoA hydratase/carnithine racemase